MFNRLLQSLCPYTAGEQPEDNREYIKLNTNESPYPAGEKTLRAAMRDLRLYPDPNASALKRAIAEANGVAPSNVFVGNGSDEVLAFAFFALFNPDGEGVTAPEITYSFYPVYAKLFGLKYNAVPMREDYGIDVSAMLRQGGEGFVFANPNAPTGIAMPLDDVLRLSNRALTIADEAYIDFGGESAARHVLTHNLAVVRTFSKAYSLAGARVGYMLAREEVIAALEMVKNSFNSYTVSSFSQAAATAALGEREYYQGNIALIISERDRLINELNALGYPCLPSSANFVFARCPLGGERTYLALKSRGILVRHFPTPTTRDFIRITIGSPPQNTTLLSTLKALA